MDIKKEIEHKGKGLFFLLITALAVSLLVMYVSKNAGSFKKILQVSLFDVCIFIILQTATLLINALIQSAYTDIFKVKVSLFDSFGINAVTTFFNNIFVKSGSVVRGYILKKAHNFPISGYVFFLATFTVVELFTAGVIGLLGMATIGLRRGYFNGYLFLFFMLLCLVSIAAIKFPYHRFLRKRRNRIMQALSELSDFWLEISVNRPFMLKLFLLALASFAVFAVRLQYGFYILYGKADFLDCLLISIFGVIANILSFTPSALGIRELFVATSYGLINGDTLQAVVVTLLDRVVAAVYVLALGGFFLIYFLRKAKAAKKNG